VLAAARTSILFLLFWKFIFAPLRARQSVLRQRLRESSLPFEFFGVAYLPARNLPPLCGVQEAEAEGSMSFQTARTGCWCEPLSSTAVLGTALRIDFTRQRHSDSLVRTEAAMR